MIPTFRPVGLNQSPLARPAQFGKLEFPDGKKGDRMILSADPNAILNIHDKTTQNRGINVTFSPFLVGRGEWGYGFYRIFGEHKSITIDQESTNFWGVYQRKQFSDQLVRELKEIPAPRSELRDAIEWVTIKSNQNV
jgi:hypothetical protein